VNSKKKAIVATGHPVVSEAAIEVLENGGNAFDAAVAAGFAGAVAEPALTSLGGGGFLLARTEQGREILFDFFSDTPGKGLAGPMPEPHFFPVTVHFPGSEQVFNIGLGSVAVPGNLKGFLHVHERLGRIPLAEVVAPAVRAAAEGVRFNSCQAYFMGLLKPIMTLSETGGRLYEKNGKYIAKGEFAVNRELAAFLEDLPRDLGRDFYVGSVAGKIVSDMRDGQGFLTADDLASYRVTERPPLSFGYRGRRIITNPPPSFGGSLIAMAFKLLAQYDIAEMQWGSPEHLLVHSMVMQEVDRRRDANGAAPDEDLHAWYVRTSRTIRTFSRGTTHVSVTDTDGNVASMTTSNGEGSGYFAPGTGIMLNNMMGEDDLHPEGFHSSPPGRRIASMMSPAMVVREGDVELVLGSGGSKRIRTVLTQVISHVLDFGMEIRRAVRAPRVHWDGDILQVEPGFDVKTLSVLKTALPTNVWTGIDMYFGGVNAISGNDGAGDPRRGGDSRGALKL